jgi:hypothetical protein
VQAVRQRKGLPAPVLSGEIIHKGEFVMNFEKFDTCSYEELSMCIHARIGWIREIDSFCKDKASKKYPYIEITNKFHKLTLQNEIKNLLKMRRVLKRLWVRNWNTATLKGRL